MEEMGRGRLVGPSAERVTFADLKTMLTSEYQTNGRKSLKRAEVALRSLGGYFGISRAVDITTDRITEYIRQRLEAGIKPATIHYDLAILKRMFTLALRAEKLDKKPYIPSIEVRNVRAGFFLESEFRAVLSHLPDEVRAIAELLYLTGWRKTEALTLEWRQIDWIAKTIRLEPGTTKNDDGRMFPFGNYPELEAMLSRQREYTEVFQQVTAQIIPWVFHRRGKQVKDFRKSWDNACEAVGLPGRWLHDFRRSCVRRMEQNGVPRSWAMKLTGHKTESIYLRYAIVSESDLSEAVTRLANPQPSRTAEEPARVVPLQVTLRKVHAKQRQS
ncbi:MAG: site-specific integrase [Acidobacteria bacterium]|nr:site-specific integrase [Acidobacteriota bacterium]